MGCTWWLPKSLLVARFPFFGQNAFMIILVRTRIIITLVLALGGSKCNIVVVLM